MGNVQNCDSGADNLTAIYESIVWAVWDLNISEPYRPPRPLMGIALLFFFTLPSDLLTGPLDIIYMCVCVCVYTQYFVSIYFTS
jgi:hypothetical protein